MRNIVALSLLLSTTCCFIFPQILAAAPVASASPSPLSTEPRAHASPSPSEAAPTVRPEYDHGPRAGFMRGTKDVQSELLLGPGTGIRLYFVDAAWIDIPLKDSAVKVGLRRKGGEVNQTELTCTLGTDCYSCALPKSMAFSIGDTLEVDFTKPGEPPQSYSFHYSFPFQSSGN